MSFLTQTSYPYFKKGQVLKHTDLNNLVDSFDQHNRVTRVMVAGSGIFYGLTCNLDKNLSYDTNAYVKINVGKGFGLSSDGYFIYLEEDVVYTHYKKRQVSSNYFKCESSASNETDWEVLELLSSSDSEEVKVLIDLVSDISESQQYCLVLWVSVDEEARPVCIDKCDQSGADLVFSIKALLVKKTDLNTVYGSTDTSSVFNLPVVTVNPFGFQEKETSIPGTDITQTIKIVNPSLIEEFLEFYSNYTSIILKNINTDSSGKFNSIPEAYTKAYELMNTLGFDQNQNPFKDLKSKLNQIYSTITDTNSETIYSYHQIQYLYDYIFDLCRVYGEFSEKVCVMNEGFIPDFCKYSQFLALSELEVSNGESITFEMTEGCRTPYTPSTLSENYSETIRELEFLYDRMIRLTQIKGIDEVGYVELPLPDGDYKVIRVTPSRSNKLKLGQKAIPYYYTSAIKDYWKFKPKKTCIDLKILGYRYTDTSGFLPTENPLCYSVDEFTDFRIEGHIGRPVDEVRDELVFWQLQYNLPIDVHFVYLNSLDLDLEDIVYPNLELLQEKYTEIADELRKFLIESDISNTSAFLPEKLFDFSCTRLNEYLKEYFPEEIPNRIKCMSQALTILRLEYDLEQERVINHSKFSEFARNHPGLRHNGMVPEGGTFVVAYRFQFNNVEDEDIASVLERNDKNFLNVYISSEERRAYLLDYLRNNTNRIVVGDFYLPYKIKNDQGIYGIDPLLILIPNEYCSNDTKSYQIFAYPKQGSLSASINGSPIDEGNLPVFIEYNSLHQYVFFPSKVVLGESIVSTILITYNYYAKTASAEIKVYKKPEVPVISTGNVSFIYDSRNSLVGLTISFQGNDTSGIYQSNWVIDGLEMESAGNTFTHSFYFNNGLTYILGLTHKNGVCETSAEQEINLCEKIAQIELNFNDETPFFSEDPAKDETINLIVSPSGGRFELVKEDGTVFEPKINFALVNHYTLVNSAKDPLPYGEYTLKYYLPFCDKEPASLQIVVRSESAIVLNKYLFCSGDEQHYSVYIWPNDGELTVSPSGVVRADNNVYFFDPTLVTNFENNVALVTLQLESEGTTIQRTLYVIKTPKGIVRTNLKYLYDRESNCRLTGCELTFEVESPGRANRYEWQINDETKAVYTTYAPFVYEFSFEESTSFVIKLLTETYVDGKEFRLLESLTCRHESSLDVNNLCPNKKELFINAEYDQKYEMRLNVVATPPGGEFIIIAPDGTILTDLSVTINSEETDCSKNKNYYINLAALQKELVGNCILRYRFAFCNNAYCDFPFVFPKPSTQESGEVEINTLNIRSLSASTTRETSDKTIVSLLNSRSASYKAVLEGLKSDSGLAQTKSFALSEMFLIFSGKPSDIHLRYNEVQILILNSMKRAKKDRENQLKQILETITSSYFDKIVGYSGTELDTASITNLKDVSVRFKEQKFNLKKIVTTWNGAAISELLKNNLINQITKVFTS